MSLTKELARQTAQILYPELWTSNPLEAVAMAIKFLHEAAFEKETTNDAGSPHALENASRNGKSSVVVEALRAHMKRAHMHINVVSRAIGVSAYTVRTWIDNKYQPNEANTKKISDFLEQLQATPEIMKPE